MSNKYLLFSAVGSSDPIRDGYDGPMLHIVREYKPQVVVLFLSQEMAEYDKKDNRYEKCIQYLARQLDITIHVEKIITDIANAHDFDAFIKVFNKNLLAIKTNYPEHKMLLNISSGTPQMQITMAIETILSKGKYVSIQVSTPAKRANHSKHNVEIDIESEYENNLDTLPEAENRCIVPPLLSMRKNNFKAELAVLLQAYNYSAALAICEFEQELFSQDIININVYNLVQHLYYRSQFNISQANKVAIGLGGLQLFPIKENKIRDIMEYFMLMRIRQERQELPDFFMRLSPFICEVAEHYLEKALNVPLSKISIDKKLKIDVIKKNYSGLLEQLQKKFRGQLRDNTPLGLENMLVVIEYFEIEQEVPDKTIYNILSELRLYEREIRNKAAHSIIKIDEDFIKTTANSIRKYQPMYTTKKTSKDMLNDCRKLMQMVFPRETSINRFMYDEINKMIMDLI